ncbi:peptidase S41 [Maribacter sp. MJ134]|uniref:S41 family peptidase n=1 Tax=Maribacter sp. MJ134 TaxID=2496865 RepID=UPI000F8459A2|nr:S41 family peptidase [Maribacter sp. MJ134]AZQ58277.1 peptidase S41 [Maribacter sp. MJ134]
MFQKNFSFIITLLLLFSCGDNNEDIIEEDVISVSAVNFINEIIDIMEFNSLNRNGIDWSDFRSQVFEAAGQAQSIEEVYNSGAIKKALSLLDDNHSFISRENGQFISASTAVCPLVQPSRPDIPEDIGYIFIRGFSSSNEEEIIAFAQGLQDVIRDKDSSNLKGWIVDLRVNTGGNMWPMLAGIGPILGEGIAGYFIGANGDETSWEFSQGKAISGFNTIIDIQDSYNLINPNPKVAVLLDNATASSGEVMAISFINRDNSASFGTSTCGLSTGNTSFSLSDNSNLLLTTVVLADRQKNTFGDRIIPNFEASEDEIIARAIEYIRND